MSTGPERRLVVRPEAEQEIAEAAQWYGSQLAGLGAEFLNVVEVCMASILQYPESYPDVRSGLRRAVVRRFPYNLVYVLHDDDIVVLGCIHGRRNPETWQHRK